MQNQKVRPKGEAYVMRLPTPPARRHQRASDSRKDIAKAVTLIQDTLQAAALGKSFRERPLCFNVLYGCWDFVLGEKEGLDFAFQKHPSFPNSLLSSLFCHHTLQYLNEFEDRLLTGCSCDKTDSLIAWLHLYNMPYGDKNKLFEDLFVSVFRELGLAVNTMWMADKILEKNYRIAPRPAISSSVAWYQKTECPFLLELITMIVHPSTRSHFLNNTCEHDNYCSPPVFHRLIDMVIQRMKDEMAPSLDPVLAPKLTAHNRLYRAEMMQSLCGFVRAVFAAECAMVTTTFERRKSVFLALYDVCKMFRDQKMPNVDPGVPDKARRMLVEVTSMVYMRLLDDGLSSAFLMQIDEHAMIYEMPDLPPLPSKPEDYSEDLASMIWFVLNNKRSRCMNINCQKCPCSTPEMKSFSRCAGCKVATFCSRECQRTAWSAKPHPHKEICKDLCALVAIWGNNIEKTMLIIRSNTWSKEPLNSIPEIVRATARRGGYDDERIMAVWHRAQPLWMKLASNGHTCLDDTEEEEMRSEYAGADLRRAIASLDPNNLTLAGLTLEGVD